MKINDVLQIMVEKQASDLFVTSGFAISCKVNGQLTPIDEHILTQHDALNLVHQSMSEAQKQEFETQKECNFAVTTDSGRFRVSAFWQREQAGMVVRRIVTQIPTPEELKLPQSLLEQIMKKRGLMLVVGGTGTGKSTSLAALLGHRNKNSKGHILTIEDPIEFVHPHLNSIVTQREVGLDTPSFSSALKSSLRQAPDVILIGEIRSQEIMEYALSFAETGHLCVATLHANSANQAIDRIMHLVPKSQQDKLKFELALNLNAIVAQQLIPTIEDGRAAAFEILINTPLVAEQLKQGDVSGLKETMAKSLEQGMQTFDQSLFNLYQAKQITYDNALHYADSPNDLRLKIKMSDTSGNSMGTLSGATIDGL